MDLSNIIPIIFGCLIGWCVLYEPCKILIKGKKFIPVQGIVEEYESCPKGGYYTVTKYEFDGLIYKKRSVYNSAINLLPKIGTPIDLKVNPDKPNDAIFASFKDYWALIFPLLLAVAMIVVGALKLFKIIS
ncbi:MAG: DUF3592 domain-containing protein [bacterium]|nr:DUF3592 domain-containing protein [bacterium]